MIYSPAEDSYLIEKEVKKYSKGKSFLDLGAGSGIQALAAQKAGAKSILASDIDQESLACLSSLGIKSIKSDLFSNIKGKFDLIAFNPPYLPRDDKEDKESQRITTGGRKGDEIIFRFLKQSKPHLNKNGKILLLVSSLTPKNRILRLMKRLSFHHKVISKEKLFMESLEVWVIS